MNKCGNCKHWLTGDKCEEAEAPYGECGRVKLGDYSTTDTAYVKDGSGWWAAIICKEDFGCVLFEGKP